MVLAFCVGQQIVVAIYIPGRYPGMFTLLGVEELDCCIGENFRHKSDGYSDDHCDTTIGG